MNQVLAATRNGCFLLTEESEPIQELTGQPVTVIESSSSGSCFAAVDGSHVYHRDNTGTWSKVADLEFNIEAIANLGDRLIVAVQGPKLVEISRNGKTKDLTDFGSVPGRKDWFAQGPPIHIRSLASAIDGSSILAAVHVGGIPRSLNGGRSWNSTLPISCDVHEVRPHPTDSNKYAAASAVGLCVSTDGGESWEVVRDDLTNPHSLSVAVMSESILVSVQEGPFSTEASIYRGKFGSGHLSLVENGLPNPIIGKVDTCQLTAGKGRAALVDGTGAVWQSEEDGKDWRKIASDLVDVFGLAIT